MIVSVAAESPCSPCASCGAAAVGERSDRSADSLRSDRHLLRLRLRHGGRLLLLLLLQDARLRELILNVRRIGRLQLGWVEMLLQLRVGQRRHDDAGLVGIDRHQAGGDIDRTVRVAVGRGRLDQMLLLLLLLLLCLLLLVLHSGRLRLCRSRGGRIRHLRLRLVRRCRRRDVVHRVSE